MDMTPEATLAFLGDNIGYIAGGFLLLAFGWACWRHRPIAAAASFVSCVLSFVLGVT